MNDDVDYLNFLKTFYHEEIFLIDALTHEAEVKRNAGESPPGRAAESVLPEDAIPEISFHWKFMGDEKAKIAFILNEKCDGVLPESLRDRFITMLGKLELNMNNILVANTSEKLGTVVENKILSTNAEKIILMGTRNVFPEIAGHHYRAEVHRGKQMLFSPSFSDITKDKNQVLAFWEAMKSFL